jgi:hypothetical protein
MRMIAIVVVMVFGLLSPAEAGRRGGGGAHAPRGRSSGMTGTGSSPSSHAVRGYTKKNGTKVAPHRQTDPDHTQRNNYSTKNNVNPSNGKTGTRYATH